MLIWFQANFDNDTASKQNETNVNNDSANSAPTPSTKPSNGKNTILSSNMNLIVISFLEILEIFA